LTLRELLSVSSDWKDVNKKNPNGGAYSSVQGSGQNSASGVPMDF
jgi:hypothetical protein